LSRGPKGKNEERQGVMQKNEESRHEGRRLGKKKLVL